MDDISFKELEDWWRNSGIYDDDTEYTEKVVEKPTIINKINFIAKKKTAKEKTIIKVLKKGKGKKINKNVTNFLGTDKRYSSGDVVE